MRTLRKEELAKSKSTEQQDPPQ